MSQELKQSVHDESGWATDAHAGEGAKDLELMSGVVPWERNNFFLNKEYCLLPNPIILYTLIGFRFYTKEATLDYLSKLVLIQLNYLESVQS